MNTSGIGSRTSPQSQQSQRDEQVPSMLANLFQSVRKMFTPEGFRAENIGNSKSSFAYTRPGSSSSVFGRNKNGNDGIG